MNRILISFILFGILAGFFPDTNMRAETSQPITLKEQYDIFNISWSIDPNNRLDEISVTDEDDNVVYAKRKYLRNNEIVVDRKIIKQEDKFRELIFSESYYIRDDEVLQSPAPVRIINRIVERIRVRHLLPTFYLYEYPESTLMLDSYFHVGEKSEYWPINLAEIDLFSLGNLRLSAPGIMRDGISSAGGCIIEAPILRDYSDPDEDQWFFNFYYNPFGYMASNQNQKTKQNAHIFRRYCDFLKNTLFSLNLTTLLASRKYKGNDLLALKCCFGEQDGITSITTNLDSIIMWEAFRTSDLRYIRKTYQELKHFHKTKPRHLYLFLDAFFQIDEPLKTGNTTIPEIIRQIENNGGK